MSVSDIRVLRPTVPGLEDAGRMAVNFSA